MSIYKITGDGGYTHLYSMVFASAPAAEILFLGGTAYVTDDNPAIVEAFRELARFGIIEVEQVPDDYRAALEAVSC